MDILTFSRMLEYPLINQIFRPEYSRRVFNVACTVEF